MSPVPVAVLQLLFSLLAGAALFLLWRFAAGKDKVVLWLVTAGTLIRAAAGVTLFWISYLSLPFARSLQAGNGIWFFALDSHWYLGVASNIASGGPLRLLPLWHGVNSSIHVHSLAALILFFGSSAAVGILLNIAAFLGSCVLMLKIGQDAPVQRRRIAIGLLSLSPTAILWSLQPLKDTYFVLVLLLFIFGCHRWQGLAVTAREGYRVHAMIVATLAVAAAQFVVSNFRWYFGLIFIPAVAPFLLTAITHSSRRAVTIAFAIVLMPLLITAMIMGGARQIPSRISEPLHKALLMASGKPAAVSGVTPLEVVTVLDVARSGFDHQTQGSLIGAGNAVVAMEHTNRPSAAVQVIPVSRPGKLITGLTAIFLPRAVGSAFGLVDIRGGRSLWLFAEVDTVFFLAVVVYTLWCVARALRQPRTLTPTFWLVSSVAVMLTGLLVYTVSNFGTLFRHRGMIFVLLLVIPLTIRPSRDFGARAHRSAADSLRS